MIYYSPKRTYFMTGGKKQQLFLTVTSKFSLKKFKA